MFRDITLGQYYAQESLVHNLDPRTKLFAVLIYIVTLFLVKNPYWYLLSLFILLSAYYLAKVPLSYALKGLRGIIILLVLTFVFRAIATPGTVLFGWGIFEVTEEGLIKAISLTTRIALMIMGAALLSYTSTPKSLADGLEKAFSFLEKIHIPIHDMSVIVMIAFRFIPIMIEELNMLIDAQSARGAKFEDANFWQKSKNVYTLLVPLFLSIIQRSSDLAMAMETRGYTGDNQISQMYPLVYRRADKFTYLLSLIFLGAFISIRL